MSMLGEQIKELREKADLLDGLEGMDNLVPMLREAADTIEDLRDRLQNQAFALGMQEALGSRTCDPVETEVITYYDEYGHDAVKVHVMECDECGGTYEHINGDYERCPRCGKTVRR